MWQEGLLAVVVLGWVAANYPQFDPNTKMQPLYLPSDARVGSVIYRLRATDSDKDYPLHFAATDYGSYVVRIEDMPCSKKDSLCEANVFLERSVTPSQVFKFRLTVKDTRGDTTTSTAVIEVTHGETDFEHIFPHVPGVIMIPEDTKVGTEIEYVVVRKNPKHGRPANLELWGATDFEMKQTFKKDTTTGIIVVAQPVDYEVKTMYNLSVYATGIWIDSLFDTRNVAGFELVVVISDVQDTPPVWDPIAPITYLSPNLTKGDTVLRVTARDGDRGSPRDVRYALVSEGNPFTVFFSIDQVTGEIRLVRRLKELSQITRVNKPILLTVMAEEVAPPGEVGDTSTATVALLLVQQGNSPPYFANQSYVTDIPENSPQGRFLVFSKRYITEVRDSDMGKLGVFSLSLENNNGTFEITPTVGERNAKFTIRVRDNRLLDYEKRTQLSFRIWAKEISTENLPLSSSADVVVHITDLNDNPPMFVHPNYTAEASENVTTGYRLVKVEATDVDTGDGGIVKYTAILGYKNTSLLLNWDSGVITVARNHDFDREESSMYKFQIEARDNKGYGNRATVLFILYILDINDNAPRFLKSPMDFILGPDGLNFTQRAFVTAIDDDAEAPNNVVRYEILSGNYGNRFILDTETGELRVNTGLRLSRQTANLVVRLAVRAYDLGVPTLWSTGEVRIFPSESNARVVRFLLPGRNLDPNSVERTLSQITGAKVVIHSIEPYTGQYPDKATDLSGGDREKTIVTATVLYSNNAVVDLDSLQKNFAKNNTINSLLAVDERVSVYRSETRVLFWILLIILLLFLLALITFLCCCLCRWCPYYTFFSGLLRRKSAVREVLVVGETEIIEKENKSVQAEWSGKHGGGRRWWSGDERRVWLNRDGSGRRIFLLQERGTGAQPQTQPQPLLYTSQLHPARRVMGIDVEKSTKQDILVLEDIDRGEYQVLDPARLAPAREPFFIRDGNAEILRMVTREGRAEAVTEEPRLNQPQRPFTLENQEVDGKVTIMRRFINDTHVQQEEDKGGKEEEEGEREGRSGIVRKVMDMDRDLSTADMNRLTAIQRDLLLTRFLVEEQRRTRLEDTQSLPGVVTMATQTDTHAETQTDKSYFAKRKSKSDNDDSEGEENGRRHWFRKTVKNRIAQQRVIEAFSSTGRSELKSPIMEEGEDTKSHSVTQTKASLIRQAAMKEKFPSDEEDLNREKSKSDLDLTAAMRWREKLLSLQATPVKRLNITDNVRVEHVRYKEPGKRFSLEIEEMQSLSIPATSREHSASSKKTQGQVIAQEPSYKTGSRYMEWYKTKREMREKNKKGEIKGEKKKSSLKKTAPHPTSTRKPNPEVITPSRSKKVVIDLNSSIKSDKSEEVRFQKEEDLDSGIAMPYMIGPPTSLKHQQAMEKKSIFTIAYDDMETKQIRMDSASPP